MKRSESFHLDLHRKKQFEDELETIRARSRLIWSRPDVSLTTHGYFYADPEQKDRTALRPTSVTRRNNPHPKLVFMRTGMREIPNAYGAPPSMDRSQARVRSSIVRPNYEDLIPNLTTIERQGVQAFLKAANEDSKENVVEAVRQFRTTMSNDYECPPIGASLVYGNDGSRVETYPSMERFRQALGNEKEYVAINHVLTNPQNEVKVETNPPAAVRHGRFASRPEGEKHFQRRSHSHGQCPWPLAHRPYRGDYSIHMDWHPRLPHHRLTCLC